MPTPNPTTRREFRGAAAATTLTNSMTNTDTSFVLVAANNWPTGAVGKFVVTVNRGLADEEKILCDSQTTRTVACLLANRGFDGTTPQAHAAGATVECTISAFDADEWNQHTNASTGVHGVATVAGLTETQTFTNKTLTGATLDATSTLGGVSGTTFSGAWTTYVPGVSNLVIGNGSIAAAGRTVGKTTNLRIIISVGTTTSVVGTVSLTPPVNAITSTIGQWIPVQAYDGVGNHFSGVAYVTSNVINVYIPTSPTNCSLTAWGGSGAIGGTALTSGASVVIEGTYEAA